MFLSSVVPVLNESKVVSLMSERLRDTLREINWEMIFVDDGSKDAAQVFWRETRSRMIGQGYFNSAGTSAI